MKYYLIFFICLFLLTCKDKKEIIYPTTDLELTVQNNAGTKLNGAIVAIFETQEAYQNAYRDYSTEGAIKVDSTVEGKVLFQGLEAKKYYIASYYKDYKYNGYDIKYPDVKPYIMFDNDVTGDSLVHPLNKGSFTEGTLTLTPAESFISFWGSNTLQDRAPIKITVDNDTLSPLTTADLLSAVIDTTTLFLPNARTIKLRRGVHPYSAINNSGCKTIEAIHITGGAIANPYIDVNTCRSGYVSFWTTSENKGLDIDIIINSNTKIGTLSNSFLTTAPTSCTANNTLYYSLVPGTHTYTATTTGCAWTGSFTIDDQSCSPQNIIKLEKCNR